MSGQYFGGEEGQSIYWWMRCYPNGQQQKIESKENSKLDLNSQLNAYVSRCNKKIFSLNENVKERFEGEK